MRPFLTAILLLVFFSAGAQLNGKITYYCSYYGGNAKLSETEICLDYGSFTLGSLEHTRMENLLDTIMAEVGLPRNYLLVRCPGISNCMAVNLQAKKGLLRYIVYDDAFLNRMDSSTNTYWATISILAHEIGHHLSGHTLDSLGSRPDKELEADRFSGFILFKLGATLEEAQAAMKLVGYVQSVTTHPPLQNRLAAIRNGWNDGWMSNQRQLKLGSRMPALNNWEEIAGELYDKAYLDNILGNYTDAIKSCNTAIYLKRGYAAAYCQRGLAQSNTGQLDAALLSLDSALYYADTLVLAQVYKGHAYANAGMYMNAEREFNKALAMDSAFAALYNERSLMRLKQARYNDAIDDATFAIALDFKDAYQPYGTLGYAYLKRGDLEEALNNFYYSLQYNSTYDFARKWGMEAAKRLDAQKKAAQKKPVVKPPTKAKH